MLLPLPSWIALFVVASGVLAAVGCEGGASRATTSGLLSDAAPGGVYLALGDSIAAGTGASDAGRTSYPALVADAYRARVGQVQLVSLAVAGHTTQDLIDQQLPAALARLEQGDVRLVTVTIGGNDLFVFAGQAACQPDPTAPGCHVEDALLAVERRLDRILADLREAGPDAVLVILAYPNLFSGSGHPFERPAEAAFDLLDGVITSVARRYDVLVADARPAFVDKGNDYTHILERTPDFHPNDEGYRALADVFLQTLGLEQ